MTRNLVNRRLPYQLGFRPSGGSAPFTDPRGAFDIAIGGIPFLLSPTSSYPMHPIVRKTADFKRTQFDNSPEPGEQTLTGWWIRSQSSFHLGAGLKFEDATEDTNRFRFEASEGVNVWTPGHVSLLPATVQRLTGGTPLLAHGANDGTNDLILYANGNALSRVDTMSPTTVAWGGSGSILSLTDNGTNYYAADSVGIYSGTLTGGAGTLSWNTGSPNVTIGWVKQRLMAGIGPKIYELTGAGPALPATATYTHPNVNWRWTSITSSPSGIYFAGYAGGRSAILRLAVSDTGALPALTQATTVAEMPTGEIVYAIYGYLGSLMAIGTNKGVRIAQVSDAGAITYGPLIESMNGPVRGFVGSDRFIYATWPSGMSDGTSGLIRIDLSQQLADGRYAYATDLRAHVSGEVTSVALRGSSGVLAFSVNGRGLYEADPANLEPNGFLKTYRIRYSTLWPKLYKRLSIRSSPPYVGTLAISTIDEADVEVSLATVPPTFDPRTDVSISYPTRPQIYTAFKYQLNRATDPTQGPTMAGYQVKAVPAGPREREYTFPVYCYDNEKDRNGVDVGYDGWAISRLRRLEALDSAGDTVLIQNLLANEAELVLIDSIEFQQFTPPTAGQSWGGSIYITCRTVAG